MRRARGHLEHDPYRLPPSFYADHVARDLPAGTLLKETRKYVEVELDRDDYDELLSDAQHYSASWQFERELFGLCSSARATVRALRTIGPPPCSVYVEVTGWNAENESVEDSDTARDGETADEAIARLVARSLIVEIGDSRVVERR